MKRTNWHAEVIRKREAMGPGVMRLWLGEQLRHQWQVLTGGPLLDPTAYGGLMPMLSWVMVEPIAVRKHPHGHVLEMARLLPIGDQKYGYPLRCFDLDRWPFMIHRAGHSSGSIAIPKDQWREAVEALNQAFAECTFAIEVFEEEPSEPPAPKRDVCWRGAT